MGFDAEAPTYSILWTLSEWGYFDGDDIVDAREWLQTLPACGRGRRPRRGVRTVLRVIADLERAG